MSDARAAWSRFARAIEATGAGLDEDGADYLAGLVAVALDQQLGGADPARPRFVANPNPTSKWGAENADNRYLWAPLRPEWSYRVSGRRGSSFELLFEVKEGFMQLGAPRNFAARAASALDVAPDGDFELWLGGAKPSESSGRRDDNWLPLDPDARWLLVREYFLDWEREEPARLAIERVDGGATVPADPPPLAERLDAAAAWVDGTLRFWSEWVTALRTAYEPGHIAIARRYEGGADDILYGNDWFRLAADEALVVSCAVPDARYWAFQLCDGWFRSLDYAHHQTSLNAAQARVDGDGRVRIVVAARDPGVPNWLDTTGLAEGVLQYRFVWARTTPQPTGQVVHVAALRDALPSDTPCVTPAERRAAIAARGRHVALRSG